MAPPILSLRLLLAVATMVASTACLPRGLEGTSTPSPPSVSPSPAPPTATPPPLPSTAPTAGSSSGAITVARPSSGEEVRSPVRVQGSASVFEANVQVLVKDASGATIGQGFTTATAGAPDRGDYTASVSFTLSSGRQSGMVEVFSPSPRDGQRQHLVTVPVVLLP